MQITVTTEEGAVFPLEVSTELTLQDLKAILEIEAAVATDKMVLFHNMAPMNEEGKCLKDYAIQEGDIIILTNPLPPQPEIQEPQQYLPEPQRSLPEINWGAIHIPGIGISPPGILPSGGVNPSMASSRQPDPDDPEAIRRHFQSHPNDLVLLREQNPPLAQALESGDPELFRNVLQRHTQAVRDSERQRILMLNANPLDPENQSRIAQDIERKNIDENMEAAMEYTPESFSLIVMLYVNIKVNGVTVQAMVDSGAAATIMSKECAERCGIMRLVDRRFAGVAIGVGTQRIIGKVHLGTIQIGQDFLTSSFKVLEVQTEDMLLGLDMLKRHQCCIDLKKHVLRIGTTGNETPFLTESDLTDKEETRRKQAQQVMEGEDAEMAKVIATSEQQQTTPLQGSTSNDNPQNFPTTPGPQAQALPASRNVAILEPSIQQITSAGFSRQEAITELQNCDGNVQRAMTSLLAKSISFK